MRDIPHKNYHVYALYTECDGIFYIGSGKDNRLLSTKYVVKDDNSYKAKVIRKCKQLGISIEIDILFSTNDRDEVRHIEYFFIQMYKDCLTNFCGINRTFPAHS